MDMGTFEWIVPFAVPISFVCIWLVVTALLMRFSGWLALQRRFPDQPDTAFGVMRFQSGSMGDAVPGGVSFGNSLRFDICQSGLRVRVMWVFGPFTRPFLVPWREIRATEMRVFSLTRYRLSFGLDEVGHLRISKRSARKIAQLSLGLLALPETSGKR